MATIDQAFNTSEQPKGWFTTTRWSVVPVAGAAAGPSFGANSFAARAAGGARFYTTADLSVGVNLPAGGGAWAPSAIVR